MILTDGSIWPLTVVADRYQGTYSGGKYVAMNVEPHEFPEEPFDDDITASDFWDNIQKTKISIGYGKTPKKAIKDLRRKLLKS